MAEKTDGKLWSAISLDSLVQKAENLEQRLQSSREEALFRKAQLSCVQRRCEDSHNDPSDSFGVINGLTSDYNQLLADYEQLASYAIANQNEVKRLRVELEATTSELKNLKGYVNYCEIAQRKALKSKENEASPEQNQEKTEIAAEVNSTVKNQEVANQSSNPLASVISEEVITEPRPPYDTHDLALLKVFQYLTIKEICIVRAVCKQWQCVAQHPTLWRHVEIKDAMIPVTSFYTIAEWCTMTETIWLQGLIPTPTLDDEDLNSYVVRQKGCFEPALGIIFRASSSTLKSIMLHECNIMITQRIFWLISVSCEHLNEVQYSSDGFPPTVASLWSLGIGCPSVTSLHLPPVFTSTAVAQFDDQCLATIADGWPYIRTLSIGSPSVTSAGLHFVIKQCQLLEHLCVMYSQQINDEIAKMLCKSGLQNVHTLVVMFTRTSPAAVAYFIAKCPQLKRFELHVGYSDYFSIDPSAETTVKYKMVIQSFEDLLRYPDIRRVFKLKSNYN